MHPACLFPTPISIALLSIGLYDHRPPRAAPAFDPHAQLRLNDLPRAGRTSLPMALQMFRALNYLCLRCTSLAKHKKRYAQSIRLPSNVVATTRLGCPAARVAHRLNSNWQVADFCGKGPFDISVTSCNRQSFSRLFCRVNCCATSSSAND